MQTGSHQSCKMMQSSIEDGEDGDDSNDAKTNKENTEPCMEKAAAPTCKRKRKLIPKVHTVMDHKSLATGHEGLVTRV